MIKGKTISLIIPCKNEEKALKKLLLQVPKYIDEVIVIDNNSSDKTRHVARQYGATVFIEKKHLNGIGYGYAHKKGLLKAKGDIVITMDGDNTYPIKSVKKIITHLIKNNLDFISCNRFPLKNKQAISIIRRLGVFILNLEASLLYGYKVKDILSGMWILKKEIIPLLKLKEGGWNLSPEIKLAALKQPQISFSEFHIDHTYRYNGESKQKIWETGLDHLKYILKRRLTIDNYLYRIIIKITENSKFNMQLLKQAWS